MFHFEYMGRDTCKAGVSRDVFMELRAAAVDRLVKYGVYRKSISRAGKNWVIAQSREAGMAPTAYIIDAGACPLRAPLAICFVRGTSGCIMRQPGCTTLAPAVGCVRARFACAASARSRQCENQRHR